MSLFTKQKHSQRTNLLLPEEIGGEGIVREFGADMYTLLHLK